ncbi:MAG: DAK2 domain-containing protein [Ruminococcaceae bacterium]|nr:DAK2 domain-containing protein [Oscillospiraceae bacterium]
MINGALLRDAIISGANNIINSKKAVDDLNIFPVPDGDTGTNMSMTISAASVELEKIADDAEVGAVAKAAASAMLRGARGNSGVILSLLFRGFSKGLEGLKESDGRALVNALSMGVEAAYKAVMKPTEGTILTVSRVGAEVGTEASEIDTDPVYVWSSVCMGAAKALAETPEMLPVLKKAGVVDAGGQGLLLIFEGMLQVFKGEGKIEKVEAAKSTDTDDVKEFFASVAAEFDSEITFTYCTEFIVGRNPECETDPMELRAYLETIGDCVVVVDDDDIIKTHVHTENPGNALQKALEFGSLLTVKIENMREQHRKAKEENEAAKKSFEAQAEEKKELEIAEPTEPYGFVAVAAGDGLRELFTDVGCNQVVSGGQTMNPSTEDIMAAVLATPAEHVYVLPNNKNIIMAAEQCIPLVTDRKVTVVPTRTIPQGLSAMLAFDPDADGETNKESMLTQASMVETGLVTFAARDSEYGGAKIKEGDILGLTNGKMEYIEKDPVNACYRVTRNLVRKHGGASFITLIYGEGLEEEKAQEAYDKLMNRYKGTGIEITLVNGGQPVYYFMISVE